MRYAVSPALVALNGLAAEVDPGRRNIDDAVLRSQSPGMSSFGESTEQRGRVARERHAPFSHCPVDFEQSVL
jgi:hypothetical protein